MPAPLLDPARWWRLDRETRSGSATLLPEWKDGRSPHKDSDRSTSGGEDGGPNRHCSQSHILWLAQGDTLTIVVPLRLRSSSTPNVDNVDNFALDAPTHARLRVIGPLLPILLLIAL